MPSARNCRVRRVGRKPNDGVRREELRRLLDADLTRDRGHCLVEAGDGVLGLEYVEDAEGLLGFASRVEKESRKGKVRRRFEPILTCEPADDLLVALAGQAWRLMDRDHQHPNLLDKLSSASFMRALHRLALGVATPVARALRLIQSR